MWQYQLTKMCKKKTWKEAKIQELMYRDTTNVEHEMYDYTGTDWSHWNSNKGFKENFWKPCQEITQETQHKRQLYVEHHTQYGKYCSVKLEA
jgi:hypothetical protein